MTKKNEAKPANQINSAPAIEQPGPLESNNSSEKASAKTEAMKIWDEIKDLTLDLYSLPNQIVSSYFTPFMIEPSRLYLTMKASAALAALEEELAGRFTVEMVDKFIVVARKHG